ncbi:MAG: hypothetical protein JW885_09250 [Deltaproteobacteria bacterium]|nr:hypothetical protein [Candidatus Zymogenaceae bacterium]
MRISKAAVCISLVLAVVISGAALAQYDDRTDFIYEGLYRFGKTEAEFIFALGDPLEVVETERPNTHRPKKTDTIREYIYEDVSFSIYEVFDGKKIMMKAAYTSDAYEFDGLSVGDSAFTVTRRLGQPDVIDDGMYLYFGEIYEEVRFLLENGAVVEIDFIEWPD